MAHNSKNEQSIVTAWTPDLFGPIFKKESLTLKEVLNLRNVDEQIHLMATFVPDELIYKTDLLEKSFHSFQATLMYLNIPDFLSLFKKYFYGKNGGSLDLTALLNNYIHIMVNQIYCSDGDVLKFSVDGILAMWKVHDGEFMFNVVQKVIVHAMDIQNCIAALKKDHETSKVNITISAGEVMFSIIGSEETRHFVMSGLPIEELKHAKKISMPGDLVLSLSAWQHCSPSQYEYVIKDANNIKILKLLKLSETKLITPMSLNDSVDNQVHINSDHKTFINRKLVTNSIKPSIFDRKRALSINSKAYSEISFAKKVQQQVPTAISTIAATNPNFGTLLKSYLIKPVVQQIEKNESLKHLADVRRITVMFLDIIPNKCSENELIRLTDKCFLLLHSIVTQYAGCINMVNLHDSNIFFSIVFGIHQSNDEDQFKIDETCKNGIICAMHVLQAVRNIVGIRSAFVGVSTGMAYCGVIGHIARKYYAIIGPPVNKAIKLMDISYNKISCDYDTVLHSHLNKNQFRSRGMRTWNQLEKYHVYEYLGDMPIRKDFDATLSLDYCYPILGRMQELECFNDILDEIGVANRHYSGLLIEGRERSGKSRLLDSFAMSVCNRQIQLIKLSLHVTYADKAYAVIYHIILQLFQADDSDTVEERQKALLLKLGDVLALEDFCYLNTLLRVRFPLSHTYCSDSEWQRHVKTINIFKTILKQLKTKICILLDDVQHIDYTSWQFLSSALDNDNVMVAMTMLKINSGEDLSQAKTDICKDSRIKQRILLGLNVDLLPALTCQFLNVLAIPRTLSRVLQKRKDGYIGWCELYLTLLLQNNSLAFIEISPNEAKQHDLIFPDASLVTKLPIDLTPEELAPPSTWSQMSHLNVCVMSGNYFKMFDTNRSLKGKFWHLVDTLMEHILTCSASS
ncbi:adenylate cyclase type 10-like [Linepithema humile]|uniref:adenylate cyclase type 10-like n=1 Tax=Linepithema humile TaxID=83485 RepID=UPI00351DB488